MKITEILNSLSSTQELSIEIPDADNHIVPVYRIGDVVVEETVWRDVVRLR